MGIIEDALKLREKLNKASLFIPEEKAPEFIELYPAWNDAHDYLEGTICRYNGTLYKVITAHRSQADWTPNQTPSLYSKVLIPGPAVIPEWEQPDSTNGYSNGDKVSHNGFIWLSLVDNNVWEPGIIGTESVWIRSE